MADSQRLCLSNHRGISDRKTVNSQMKCAAPVTHRFSLAHSCTRLLPGSLSLLRQRNYDRSDSPCLDLRQWLGFWQDGCCLGNPGWTHCELLDAVKSKMTHMYTNILSIWYWFIYVSLLFYVICLLCCFFLMLQHIFPVRIWHLQALIYCYI